MTRQELAKMDANKIRRKPDLFALFKKYLAEDVSLVWKGRTTLPSGCFNCAFNTNFAKWKNIVLQSKTKKMSNSKKTFKLKDNATKFYFNGGVLDKNSSDKDWREWIDYPVDKAKVAYRESFFETLPEDPNAEQKALHEQKKKDDSALLEQQEQERLAASKKLEDGKVEGAVHDDPFALENLDREGLLKFIADNEIEIQVKEEQTDEEVRDAIAEILKGE